MKLRRPALAFTLIELLIVVAIIAILAAIAVPNFLEAQMRAKVTRVKTDFRTIAVALEAYATDHNAYPHIAGHIGTPIFATNDMDRGGIHMVWNLTSPVAYLTTVNFTDPFYPKNAADVYGNIYGFEGLDALVTYSYTYANIDLGRERKYPTNPVHFSRWLLLSLGPDYIKGPDPATGGTWKYNWYCDIRRDPSGYQFVAWLYDPTNGTVSFGDILRWQAGPNR